MRSECLYMHDEQCIGADEFTEALRAIGAKDNDVLFVHSDIKVFGKLGAEADRDDLCRHLVEAIAASAPGGTVVMPAFTYSFGGGKPFDLQESPSEVGTLSEFFRTEAADVRSRHPMYSVTAKGSAAKELLDIDMDAFGTHSFFSNLLAAGGLIVSFGAPYLHSATFMHYIEQTHGVPYRFLKTFRGGFQDEGVEREVSCTSYVRHLDQDADVDTDRLEARLRAEGFLKEIAVGAGKIMAVRAQDEFAVGMQMLDENIYDLSTAFLRKS